MYQGTTPEFDAVSGSQSDERRPTIALMGEFSAGKTTLINFLLGDDILPTRVTATQLPPVWMSYGERAAFFVDDDGNEHEVALDDLGDVGVEGVRYIRLFADTGILSELDLIDTPGISDPNIPIQFRDFVAAKADALLWCTHSTQAWRESERSALDSMPKELLKHSVLLATRADKLLPAERSRVHERLVRETGERFANIIMFSATDAIDACANEEAGDLWRESGGEELLDTLHHLSVVASDPDAPRRENEESDGDVLVLGRPVVIPEAGAAAAEAVVPRRIRRLSTARRPAAEEFEEKAVEFAAEDVSAEAEHSADLAEEFSAREDAEPEKPETADWAADTEEDAAPVSSEAEFDSNEEAPDVDQSADLIAAISVLAADEAAVDQAETAEVADDLPEVDEPLDEGSKTAKFEEVDVEDKADFSNIFNRMRDEEKNEEQAHIAEIPEPDEDLLAAWRAYRAEHAPDSIEALDGLIIGFLATQQADTSEDDAAETPNDGWRLYV